MDVAFVGRRKNEYFGELSGICLRTVSDEAQVLTPLGSPFLTGLLRMSAIETACPNAAVKLELLCEVPVRITKLEVLPASSDT